MERHIKIMEIKRAADIAFYLLQEAYDTIEHQPKEVKLVVSRDVYKILMAQNFYDFGRDKEGRQTFGPFIIEIKHVMPDLPDLYSMSKDPPKFFEEPEVFFLAVEVLKHNGRWEYFDHPDNPEDWT